MKILLLLLLFAILLFGSTLGQVSKYELFKQSLVSITEGEDGQIGSGFIIGLKDENLMIVTASHVVGKNQSVQVQLTGSKVLYNAIVEQQNLYFDLALLSLPAGSFKWTPVTYTSNITAGDTVFIFSVHRNNQLIPSDSSGIVSDLDDENLVVKIRGIIPGDSGTPLWSQNGLAGMIYTKSPEQARSIQLIKKMVESEWKGSWQLAEKNNYRPPEKKEVPPDFDRETIIPIASISEGGTCGANTSKIIDGNTATYWSCNEAMWKTFSITLQSVKPIRKLKLYFPDNYSEDLPKGEITISGQTITLTKSLARFVERESTGIWYTYDLGAFYNSDKIFLSLKVKKDNTTEKVIPVRLYELKIIGPK